MKRFNLLSVALIGLILISYPLHITAQVQITEATFRDVKDNASDNEKTLSSVVKLRDISQKYATGGLYLMTHYGDNDDLFKKENQRAIDYPMIEQTWRFCSIFSTTTDDGVVMGRNWDNQNVGSVIVSYYKPSNGYASVSIARAIDMGFPLNVRLDEMAQSPFGDKLLAAPFYAYDGMNEHGLCASVTGISTVKVSPLEGKESMFIGYIIRKILDNTKTVDEAVNLVVSYVPFDLAVDQINCHFLIADSHGNSVILEYINDEWKKIYPDGRWQIMTNKVIFNASDKELREKCWRYNDISASLEDKNGNINRDQGMQILKDVSQQGTTWSVVYLPSDREIYLSVYQDWDQVYHLKPF